jgi:CheY-like chemotaxis protein
MKKNLVLYAEDDEDDIEAFREALSTHEGYELKTFCNGLELLNYLLQNRPNEDVRLIVLDINMHLMGGISTLVKLKAEDDLRHIPVVLFSTARNPMDVMLAGSLHTDVLMKPRTQEGMLQSMDTLLGHVNVQEPG